MVSVNSNENNTMYGSLKCQLKNLRIFFLLNTRQHDHDIEIKRIIDFLLEVNCIPKIAVTIQNLSAPIRRYALKTREEYKEFVSRDYKHQPAIAA